MRFIGSFFLAFGLTLVAANIAEAQTCSSYPNTLTNGTTADATAVMGNFNSILNCANNSLAPSSGGTLTNATLSGTTLFTGGNVGIGTTTPAQKLSVAGTIQTTTGGVQFPDGTIQSTAATAGANVRQTVLTGPVDVNGLPTFLPSTSASLSLTSQNISSATPFVATAANNFSGTNFGPLNQNGHATSNLAWSGLIASTTNYLYVTISSSGVLTTGATTLQPIYQFGGAPSVATGQFTFNISQMVGYLGNGSAAPQAYVVFLGEAVTNSSAVTGTVAYAYNGLYDSGFTATLPSYGSPVSKNSGLGVIGGLATLVLQCTTADNGYSVGDQLIGPFGSAGATYFMPVALWVNRNTVGFTLGNSASYGFLTQQKTSGAQVNLTASAWEYKLVVKRAW